MFASRTEPASASADVQAAPTPNQATSAKAAKRPRRASSRKKRAERKKTAKRRKTRRTTAKTSKAAFILAQPADMPAAAIVTRAAKLGLKFSVAYVYTSRANAARRKNSAPVSRRRATPARNSTGADETMRRLIAELGLARARAVLSEVVAAFGGT